MFYPHWFSKLIGAMFRDPILTHKDHLEFATSAALGTDDAAVDKSIEDVGDKELILEWSNLPEFRLQSGVDASPDELAEDSLAWPVDIARYARCPSTIEPTCIVPVKPSTRRAGALRASDTITRPS